MTGSPVPLHVLASLDRLPPDRSGAGGRAEWTTVKVLRRLAWHEPGELVVLHRLLARACCAGGQRRWLGPGAGVVGWLHHGGEPALRRVWFRA